nr:unnamed protein product [Callosobruchus chinensis]
MRRIWQHDNRYR